MKLRPQFFTANLASGEHPECVWTQRKPLHFWTRKCVNNFFINLTRQRTSRILLKFTANRFIFGRTNRGIAPRTLSVKLAGRGLPKCVWTLRQTASFFDAQIVKMRPELLHQPCNRRIPKIRLNSLYAVTWKRLQSWKYVPYVFEKIFKLSFVKFSPVKEIASKKCKCRFSKFLSAGVQKRCRKCRFFAA